MTTYDSPWKETLDLFFPQFLGLLFPLVYAEVDWTRGHEFLDKELEKIDPEDKLGSGVVDKLVKVWLVGGEERWLLLHIEVQCQEEGGFPRRMFAYHSAIFHRYNQEVVSLAVLGDERPGWRPDVYCRERWGCRLEFQYPIVKLLDWQTQARELAVAANPVAHVVLAHLRALETMRDPDARRTYKFQVVRNLYDLGMDSGKVRQLLRLIDWMMTLPMPLEDEFLEDVHSLEQEKHMPFVPSYERRAMEEGLQKGREEGLEKGLQSGIKQSIETLIRERFGDLAEPLADEIGKLDNVEQLNNILREVVCADSLDEFKSFVNNLQTRRPRDAS